jgi:hypothetical protein
MLEVSVSKHPLHGFGEAKFPHCYIEYPARGDSNKLEAILVTYTVSNMSSFSGE